MYLRLPSSDYFYNMTRWPTERAREELAERVRAIPGGQHYTAAHVYRYFANLKSKLKSASVLSQCNTLCGFDVLNSAYA